MSPLRYAVIGVGNMGFHHARVVSELPEARLVAVCDSDEAKGRKAASYFGCRYFRDHLEMITSLSLDAVSIAVPTHEHERTACAVMRQGIHVLLEKPIAGDLESASRISSCAEETGVKLMIGHVERFNPAVERLKDLVREGRFGRVISLNIRRVGGFPPMIGGTNVLLDLAVHDVDVASFLLGRPPEACLGTAFRCLLQEQEDYALLLMNYGGTVVSIEVNWITPVKIRTLDITGTACFGRLDYITQEIVLYENPFFKEMHRKRNGSHGFYPDYREFLARSALTDRVLVGVNREEPLRREIRSFLTSIRENTDPMVSAQEATEVLKAVLRFRPAFDVSSPEVRDYV